MKHKFFTLFVLLALLLALTPAQNVPAASDRLESTPPAGLSAEDWSQIEDLLAEALPSQAYLKASNTEAYDQFGYSVAISGDTVVVGACYEASNATGVNKDQSDNSAPSAGAAYVFIRDVDSGTWSQQAYLKASNTGKNDAFGSSVAISGNIVVVGAPYEDSNAIGVNGSGSDPSNSYDSGAAYAFTRDHFGNWILEAYLKASNTGAGDFFGKSVAVSGDTVVVGAHSEDSNATGVNGDQNNNSAPGSGAAYVFTRTESGTWSQQAYLKASNTQTSDAFGDSVAISMNTVVVGASGEDSKATGVNGDENDNSVSTSGAAYVFTRSGGGTWSQQAYLKASNTDTGDSFGSSVAISGETAVVGTWREDSNATGVNGDEKNNSAGDSGAAYVFARIDGAWIQQAYLKASNTGAGDFFGCKVAISGDTVVVGAEREDSNATGVDGDQSNDSAPNSGAAYVFNRSGTTWSQQAYRKASNTEAGDYFGISVAISEDRIVIGAYSEGSNATGVNGDQTNNLAPGSGAAYFFTASPAIVSVTLRSTGAQDGWILETGESTNKGGTLNSTATTLRLGDDSAKKQYRSILSFATGAALPDNAVITKVTLKVKKQGITGGGNPVTTFQGFMVDIKKGPFGTSALQAADFQAAASKSYGPFKPTPVSNWYTINLTSGKAYINKLNTGGGLTQIRLRFKLDDNNNSTANYLSLHSGNASAASRPQLIVEYYVP